MTNSEILLEILSGRPHRSREVYEQIDSLCKPYTMLVIEHLIQTKNTYLQATIMKNIVTPSSYSSFWCIVRYTDALRTLPKGGLLTSISLDKVNLSRNLDGCNLIQNLTNFRSLFLAKMTQNKDKILQGIPLTEIF